MNKIIKWSIILTLIITAAYLGLGYISSYIGWNGYRKWEYRVSTNSIDESHKRKVFIKGVSFQFDSCNKTVIDDFEAYIEFGFRYGKNSEDETVLLTNSKFPYQLCFGYRRNQGIGVILREDQLSKFDSSNRTQGFLKYPNLRDTITVDVVGTKKQGCVIKIWE